MKTHRGQYCLYTGILLSFCLLILVYDIVYARDNFYVIEISKSKQELSVKNGNEVIKNYRVAYGKGGNGIKRKLGDKKTPLGVYKIIDFKDDSKFHFFMQLDYPNLLDAWYGYKNEMITATEFKEIATAFKNNNFINTKGCFFISQLSFDSISTLTVSNAIVFYNFISILHTEFLLRL